MPKCPAGQAYVERGGAGRCVPAACPEGALPTLTIDARGRIASSCVTPCAAGQVYLRRDDGDLCLDPPPCPDGQRAWLSVGDDAVDVECLPAGGKAALATAAAAATSPAATAGLVAALLIALVLLIVLVSLYFMNSRGPRWSDSPFAFSDAASSPRGSNAAGSSPSQNYF